MKTQELLANSGRDIKLAIDKEVEEDIKAALKEFGFGFLGEETGLKSDSRSEYFWVVDPLDGTSNYFRNIPILCQFNSSNGFSVQCACCCS